MEELIKEDKFRSLAELENTKGLDVMGLYAIRVKDFSVFEEPFRTELKKRKTTLIYIGKGNNIRIRLNQECRGISNGTFFRSIGAILGYKPPKGSLIGRRNQYNYKFSADDREKIVCWINENLEFSFIDVPEITDVEVDLIEEKKPLLNIRHNPQALEELRNLREECRQYALSSCEGKECKK